MNLPSTLSTTLHNRMHMVLIAGALAVCALVVAAALGSALIGVFAVVGLALGLVNLLAIETTMVKTVQRGETLSRKQFGMSSLGRVFIVTIVAAIFTIVFWPSGIGTLAGLAIFEVVSMVTTALYLLKELRKG